MVDSYKWDIIIRQLSEALRTLPAGIVELFSAFNSFLSITAFLGNVLALIALHRVTSIHPPTKLFFRCLAVTDLCVGLVVQPLFVYIIYIMSRVKEMNSDVLYPVLKSCGAVSTILCDVSILTSTAISVDRLLALSLGLRYRHTVTLRRVLVILICFWLLGASTAVMWLWREDIFLKIASIQVIICLIISIFSYVMIYLNLRQQQAQLQLQNHVPPPQGQQNGGRVPLNIARYKKAVSSILWVQLALLVCYTPYSVVAGTATGRINVVVWLVTRTLIYLNSSLNPILYCWKNSEMRQAAKDTIKQLFCC